MKCLRKWGYPKRKIREMKSNKICSDCGTEISEPITHETCFTCGKLLCLSCLKINSILAYSCVECIVNKEKHC